MADAPELNNLEITPDSSGTESQTPKTFTQAELDKIVGERLNRSKAQYDSQLVKAREEAAQQALEQAQMTEAEKYKLQLEEQKTALQAANERATTAERKSALVGKVADVNAALKLLEPEHILEDGSVNTELFLGKYPFLASSNNQPDLVEGGNGNGKPGDINYTTLSREDFRKARDKILKG
jgi:hypothetical protein